MWSSPMQWPFKTTVRYAAAQQIIRVQYAVCADSISAAKDQLLRRFADQGVEGYDVEHIVAATGQEAAQLNLPDDCCVLLG
jgi:hypothetical protein